MTADAPRQNFRIRRGDDWGQGVTIQCDADDAGNPLDITGAEVWITIRDVVIQEAAATDASHPPVVQITSPAVAGGAGGITITDGPNGQANPRLTPQQTKLLVKRDYGYDVQVKAATGPLSGIVKTVLWGSIEPLVEHTLDV